MKRTGIHGAGMVSIGDMANGAVGGAVAAAPWWDPNNEGLCVWAAYQPKSAANLAASYVDLSGNGNNTGPGVAPTWDAVNGWKGNGTTQYLTTTFIPQNDQSQTVVVQFTDVTDTGYLAGVDNGANRDFSIQPDTGVNSIYYYNGNRVNIIPKLLAGNLAIAGNQGYRNGVADGGAIGAWAGPSIFTVYILALNAGGALNLIAAYIQALAIYDCALTGPQVLAIATAMAGL